MRRKRRGGRSAGQALVEFALIAPVFILTLFGAVEFSLIVSSLGTYNFAVRDAARLGSLLGKTDANVDTKITALVKAHVAGLVMAKTTEIDVYRAVTDGSCLPFGSTTTVTIDDPSCPKNQYDINGSMLSGTSILWTVAARNDSLLDADYLGVRVLYQYTFLTGFIASLGSKLNLTAISAQRIEPQDYTGYLTHPSRLVRVSGAGSFAARPAPDPLALALLGLGIPLWRPEIRTEGAS